jgi:hypothetical protein
MYQGLCHMVDLPTQLPQEWAKWAHPKPVNLFNWYRPSRRVVPLDRVKALIIVQQFGKVCRIIRTSNARDELKHGF